MSKPSPAQLHALAAAIERGEGRVEAPARTLAALARHGWIDAAGHVTADGRAVVDAAGPLDELAAARRRRRGAAAAVVVVDDPADPRTPYCPPALWKLVRKLAPGWRYRIVHGTGTIQGTAPKPEIESAPGDWGLWAGLRGQRPDDDGRKTVTVEIPVHSVSLRVAHRPTGFRGVGLWTYRIDREQWTTPEHWAWHPVWRPVHQVISARAFAAYISDDHADFADVESEAA